MIRLLIILVSVLVMNALPLLISTKSRVPCQPRVNRPPPPPPVPVPETVPGANNTDKDGQFFVPIMLQYHTDNQKVVHNRDSPLLARHKNMTLYFKVLRTEMQKIISKLRNNRSLVYE